MVNIIGPYNSTELLDRLIDQLEKGQDFARSGGWVISDAIYVSKGNNLLSQTSTFNEYIRECIQKSVEFKTWASLKTFFHRVHREQIIAVNTAGKGGYTTEVYNICGVPPPPPEEHHEAIYSLNTIVQGM